MFSSIILVSKFLLVFVSHAIAQVSDSIKATIHRYHYNPGTSPRNVVIIGASFAGYHAAKLLARSLPSGYRVVLIEKNEWFQFTWAFPRFCVVTGHEWKAFIPYGGYLKGSPKGSYSFMKDEVTEICPKEIFLKSGDIVEYDYLVIAAGSHAELPSRVNAESKDDGIRLLQDMQQRIRDAKDLVIIGGGAAGVELAADAKAQYPEMNVTLVHSRDRLLNTFGAKLHLAAVKALDSLEVKVVLGERVSSDQKKKGSVVLQSEKEISCDLLIRCVGQKPNSSILTNLSPSSIASTGHIAVNPNLQIRDPTFANIYAAGDITDAKEQRNSRSALEQAAVVAKNIVASIEGRSLIGYSPQWWETSIDLTLGTVGSSTNS
jgi:NADH dehydrogenase FAD-containing subunit